MGRRQRAFEPDDEFSRLYDVLQRAQASAREAVRPAVSAAAVDQAARSRIADAGYGAQFIHRTGHGIGLDVHEDPYIVESNDQALVAGNVFSIEPGIYLENRFGARIEDIVVCTPDGADALNEAPRDLLVVRG